MGARLVKFAFKPEENEQIDALIKIPEEKRSVIHGIVKDYKGKIVKDAVVKLFEVIHKPCKVKPLTHTFTDECGQFLFGPLCPHKQYIIKVWFNDVKIRQLIIEPDCEDDDCISKEDIGYQEDNDCNCEEEKTDNHPNYSYDDYDDFEDDEI